MPKESRKHLSSRSQGFRYKPYSRYGPSSTHPEPCSPSGGGEDDSAERKEWEEATCPVCMEHPHNAVLLICSSYGKGCRPYMCDTSYRHSNCLDQYRKAHELRDALPSLHRTTRHRLLRDSTERDTAVNRISDSEDELAPAPGLLPHGYDIDATGAEETGLGHASVSSDPAAPDTELLCPLCRGKVKGWKVVESARNHLNQKQRSCAQEACTFHGQYEELRKHARCTHPSARPSEIDRSRLDRWMQLERQRELGDVLSTMPGATVLGDYVIEGDDDDEDDEDGGEDEEDDDDEGDEGADYPGDDGNWWTVFLLFQVFGQPSLGAGGRGGMPGSFVRGRHHPSSRTSGSRTSALWGEAMAGGGSNSSSSINNGNGNRLLLGADSNPANSASHESAAATTTTTTTTTTGEEPLVPGVTEDGFGIVEEGDMVCKEKHSPAFKHTVASVSHERQKQISAAKVGIRCEGGAQIQPANGWLCSLHMPDFGEGRRDVRK